MHCAGRQTDYIRGKRGPIGLPCSLTSTMLWKENERWKHRIKKTLGSGNERLWYTRKSLFTKAGPIICLAVCRSCGRASCPLSFDFNYYKYLKQSAIIIRCHEQECNIDSPLIVIDGSILYRSLLTYCGLTSPTSHYPNQRRLIANWSTLLTN